MRELPIHTAADQWFSRAHRALGGVLPCERGCSTCCYGIFPVTRLDTEHLREGLQEAEPRTRERILGRAREQQDLLGDAYPALYSSPFIDGWSEADVDAAASLFQSWPCPALEDGECAIYAWRPVTCRTMGIPIEENGLVQGACTIQSAVPVIKPPQAIRDEEDRLAKDEASALEALRRAEGIQGDELFLPFAFSAGESGPPGR